MALFLLPAVVALVLVRRHHHLDIAAVTLLATVAVGLPVTWLTWAGYREARRSATPVSGPSMAEVADQLAVAVDAQWTAEVAMRRLNDPWPLPVSWATADPSLTDSWDSLVKLTASGAGWPAPPPAGTWAAGPDDLAGKDRELADVLARVPTGRLVVLGRPGAGKTMLMVRLVLDLLARRRGGGPVPFLAPMASWNPAAQDLRGWLGAQLVIGYPALANPPPTGRKEPTQAAALLASGLILPVLDGLDEIPKRVRGAAISRINDALRPGQQLVVTCRTRDYRKAVRPQTGAEVTLRAAAAVQLRPLDAGTVRGYLCDDAAGPATRARWDPVFAMLGTEAPAGQALRTPLMVGLARAIYNPRPDELVGALRDPAELCDPAMADRAGVESLLLDAFIPAAYRHDPAVRWKAQDAEKWLLFLARHLEYKIASPDLAWWQLPQAAAGFALAAGGTAGAVAGVVAGVVAGAVTGGQVVQWTGLGVVAGVVAGVLTGVAVGVLAGVMATGMVLRESPEPVHGIRLRPRSRGEVGVGVGVGVVVGVGVGVGAAVVAGIPAGVLAGVLIGVAAAAGVVDQSPVVIAPLDLSSAASPPAALAGDRRTGIALGAMSGAVAGAVTGTQVVLWTGLGVLATVVVGVVAGVVVGVAVSFALSAWPSYAIARMWLAMRRSLPWQLMGFLADAHRRGVLRQTGAVYQFRHIDLQHRLAARATRSSVLLQHWIQFPCP